MFCLCAAFLLLEFVRARSIIFNRNSCGTLAPGVSFLDVEDAVDEAIDMAANAATLMANAAAQPDTPESKRVTLITQRMLACNPRHISCGLARTCYERIGQLYRTQKPGDNPLYVYCNENDFQQDIAEGNVPPSQIYTTYRRCRPGSKTQAVFIGPNVVMFCPSFFTLVGSNGITLHDQRTSDLPGRYIDSLTTASAIMLHEFAHASSITSLKLFVVASDMEGQYSPFLDGRDCSI